MSRGKRDFEVNLAGWRPGNIGSLLYRQAINRRVGIPHRHPHVKPPVWLREKKVVEPWRIELQTFELRTSLFWLFF